MPLGSKFNDPTGTADQQQCENTCGIMDQYTGKLGRVDAANVAFDVYWVKDIDGYWCSQGCTKCESCPYLQSFFDTNP